MHKIFIKTFGCELNRADSEVIAGILKKKGFNLVNNLKKAQIIIINSCGVKLPTQNKIIDYIKRIPKTKRIIIGGCLPKMINVRKYLSRIDLIFDTNSVTKIGELLQKNKDFLSDRKEKRINKPLVRINKRIAIIPIAQGCLGEPCAFCSVKQARGNLKSYSKKEILIAIRKAVRDGCTEIRLTAQDTGCWGKDLGEKLPDLLKDVIVEKGNFKIRLGMTNPNYVLEYLKELIEIYKHPKMKKFIHIPLQSGSNKVLKDMKRKYRVAQFKRIVKKFRNEINKINIATDIIVGFPTETEKDFQKTLNLLKELKPEVLNISKFGLRRNTLAEKMKQLPSTEIKRRSIEIHKLWEKIKSNESIK